MSLITKLSQNASTNIVSGLSTSVVSYFLLPGGTYRIPYVDYGIPMFALYGLVNFASASTISVTGDFIFPLVSQNMIVNKLEKLSRPISVGFISIVAQYILSGFNFDAMTLENMAKMFLLNSGSFLVADYASSTIFSQKGIQTVAVAGNPIIQSSVQNPSRGNNPFGFGQFGLF